MNAWLRRAGFMLVVRTRPEGGGVWLAIERAAAFDARARAGIASDGGAEVQHPD